MILSDKDREILRLKSEVVRLEEVRGEWEREEIKRGIKLEEESIEKEEQMKVMRRIIEEMREEN